MEVWALEMQRVSVFDEENHGVWYFSHELYWATEGKIERQDIPGEERRLKRSWSDVKAPKHRRHCQRQRCLKWNADKARVCVTSDPSSKNPIVEKSSPESGDVISPWAHFIAFPKIQFCYFLKVVQKPTESAPSGESSVCQSVTPVLKISEII